MQPQVLQPPGPSLLASMCTQQAFPPLSNKQHYQSGSGTISVGIKLPPRAWQDINDIQQLAAIPSHSAILLLWVCGETTSLDRSSRGACGLLHGDGHGSGESSQKHSKESCHSSVLLDFDLSSIEASHRTVINRNHPSHGLGSTNRSEHVFPALLQLGCVRLPSTSRMSGGDAQTDGQLPRAGS